MSTQPDITAIERAYAEATGKAPYQVDMTDLPKFIENAGVDDAIGDGLQAVASELRDMREQFQEAKDLFADFIAAYDRRLAVLQSALSILRDMDENGNIQFWDDIKAQADAAVGEEAQARQ